MGEFSDDLMILGLDRIKAILGIDPLDLTRDEALTNAAPVVTEYFEGYCKRGLAFDDEVVEEFDIEPRLPLHRYPIGAIAGFTINGVDQPAPTFERLRGYVITGYHGAMLGRWVNDRFRSSARATVTYSGGYPQDDVPADLAHAYANCCADFIGYKVTTSGGGAITGQGSPRP